MPYLMSSCKFYEFIAALKHFEFKIHLWALPAKFFSALSILALLLFTPLFLPDASVTEVAFRRPVNEEININLDYLECL